MKIKKATVEDGEVLAGLAQLLWDGHDLKELTADFVNNSTTKDPPVFWRMKRKRQRVLPSAS